LKKITVLSRTTVLKKIYIKTAQFTKTKEKYYDNENLN
jgi:hypothetical protein